MTNAKAFALGSIFVGCGLFFVLVALGTLDIGTARRMGPGFLPVALGLLLIGFGLAKLVQAWSTSGSLFGPVAWRGALLITLASIFFGLTVRTLGLVPAIAGSAFLAGYSSPTIKLSTILLLALGLSVLCYLIFIVALSMPIAVFVVPAGF